MAYGCRKDEVQLHPSLRRPEEAMLSELWGTREEGLEYLSFLPDCSENPRLDSPWWPLLPVVEERCVADTDALISGGHSRILGCTESPGRNTGGLSPRHLPVPSPSAAPLN